MPLWTAEKSWKKWGSIDPYFGVLSHDKYRGNSLTDAVLEEFFASGERHIDHVFAVMRATVDESFSPVHAVDFGCGTGRLAIPLAKRCEKVTGIDVSDAMLEESRRNCSRFGIGNATFTSAIGGLTAGQLGTYDFVHSYIVFQHIPTQKGMHILENLLGGLGAAGYVALHFTIRYETHWYKRVGAWVRHNVPFAHECIQFFSGRSWREPPMQMNAYRLDAVLMLLRAHGILDVRLETTDHGGYLGAMIFGKKSL